MKKNQRKEIQEKTVEEAVADIRSKRQEIHNLRLQQASSRLEKPARLRHALCLGLPRRRFGYGSASSLACGGRPRWGPGRSAGSCRNAPRSTPRAYTSSEP